MRVTSPRSPAWRRLRRRIVATTFAAIAAAGAHAADAPTVVAVAVRDWPRTYVADAVVEAVKQATLGAQVAGRVVEVAVKAGDSVRAGQVLLRIDPRAADQAVAASRSQIAEAEANLANAKRRYERNRDLVAQKFVSAAALDQSEAEYKAAQAQLAAIGANSAQAVAAQSYTTVTAPYAGVVGETLAELGDMAQPGRPLITVFDPHDLRVTATVPQTEMPRLKLGEPVRIQIPALATEVAALRATVIPMADARTHTTRIRLDLPPTGGLLPGQFARARFVTGVERALAVPASALVRRGEVTAVYVLDAQDRPRLRQVRPGEPVGANDVEILAGLVAGERIAANPVAAGMTPASPAH
jgi:RND family efflux transporter MFP subunit